MTFPESGSYVKREYPQYSGAQIYLRSAHYGRRPGPLLQGIWKPIKAKSPLWRMLTAEHNPEQYLFQAGEE